MQTDYTTTLGPIEQAVLHLTGLDPDHAGEVNEVGWNGADGVFGHSLADQIVAGRTLSPKQLHAAWTMIQKYGRQLGEIDIDPRAVPEPDQNAPRPVAASSTPAAPRPVGSVSVANGTATFRFAGPSPAKDELKRSFRGWRTSGSPNWEWYVPLAGQEAALVTFARRHALAGAEALALVAQAHQAETASTAALSATETIDRPTTLQHLDRLGGTLRPYQIPAVEYAVAAKRCFIADSMGLGKTIESLAAVNELEAFPCLVTCSAAPKINWVREALTWLPGRTVSVVNGNGKAITITVKDKSVSVPINDLSTDVVVINRDILHKHADALMRVGFKSLIVDESQRVKEAGTRWSQATEAIASGVLYSDRKARTVALRTSAIEVIYLLTGTAIKSRPAELINQLKIIRRLDEFGGWHGYVLGFCQGRQTRFGWDITGAANLDKLHQLLRERCYIRREKQAVLKELPPKQRTTVATDLGNRAEYQAAASDLIRWLRENISDAAALKATRAEQLVRISRLKQLAAVGKIESVKTWVEEFLDSGEKLVLFAHTVEVQNVLADAFPGCVHLAGGEDAVKRDAKVQQFQNDPECRLAVVSMLSGSEALTLTAASSVAFVELAWTPTEHEQAEDRVYGRTNDPHGANCYYLLAPTTIDEQIGALLEAKWGTVAAVNTGKARDGDVHLLDALIGQLLPKPAAVATDTATSQPTPEPTQPEGERRPEPQAEPEIATEQEPEAAPEPTRRPTHAEPEYQAAPAGTYQQMALF